MTQRYGCGKEEIGHYICNRTKDTVFIDGNLDKDCWQKVEKSPQFVDLVTGKPGFLDTCMAALWDNEYLYVGFWVEEPQVQARFTERDSPVYLENDVEMFIAGPDCYYEFQINALGTIYEVFYIWQDVHKKGSYFDRSEFDLQTNTVDMLGGFQDLSRYNKHGVYDSHIPECFTFVHFS